MTLGRRPVLSDLPAVRGSLPSSLVTRSGVLFVKMATTGCAPVLLGTEDGKGSAGAVELYWCKWPGNAHGNQSLVHEWVVAGLGEHIGAPVCRPALVQVEDVLIEGVYSNGVKLPAGTYFGSLLQSGEERQAIDHVSDDGNDGRFAYLLALWELCLGCDGQFLYDHRSDSQVWSFDHGMWFNSLEGPWAPRDLSAWAKLRWEWPDGDPRGMRADALEDAADRVAALTEEDVCEILASVPLSWNISDDELQALGGFLLERRQLVSARLRESARFSGWKR